MAPRHFSGVWEDRDESDNFAQKHDVSLAKDKIRPSVAEEIRTQVPSCVHTYANEHVSRTTVRCTR